MGDHLQLEAAENGESHPLPQDAMWKGDCWEYITYSGKSCTVHARRNREESKSLGKMQVARNGISDSFGMIVSKMLLIVNWALV